MDATQRFAVNTICNRSHFIYPTFLDLQGFERNRGKQCILKSIAGVQYGVNKVSSFKHVFLAPLPSWKLRLSPNVRYVESKVHGLSWNSNNIVEHRNVRQIIDNIVTKYYELLSQQHHRKYIDKKMIIFVKGANKRRWFLSLLDKKFHERVQVYNMNAVWPNMPKLRSFEQCDDNPALNNALNISRWWLRTSHYMECACDSTRLEACPNECPCCGCEWAFLA